MTDNTYSHEIIKFVSTDVPCLKLIVGTTENLSCIEKSLYTMFLKLAHCSFSGIIGLMWNLARLIMLSAMVLLAAYVIAALGNE